MTTMTTRAQGRPITLTPHTAVGGATLWLAHWADAEPGSPDAAGRIGKTVADAMEALTGQPPTPQEVQQARRLRRELAREIEDAS